MAQLSPEEEKFLREAAKALEFPSFLARVTNALGKPVELGIEALPDKARALVETTSRKAIEGAFKGALKTIPPPAVKHSFAAALASTGRKGNFHIAGTAMTGALGGFFGLPALVAELPLTTGIMLRSIADTAADFGEDLSRRDVQLECLSVFSFGGPTTLDNEMDSAYYTARVGLAKLIETSAAYVAHLSAAELMRAVEKKTAPALVELLVKIAGRFQFVVSEKAIGQLIPGIGAGAGAVLNVAFAEHFHSVARYHFGVKRLEREKGKRAVEEAYFDARLQLLRERTKK